MNILNKLIWIKMRMKGLQEWDWGFFQGKKIEFDLSRG